MINRRRSNKKNILIAVFALVSLSGCFSSGQPVTATAASSSSASTSTSSSTTSGTSSTDATTSSSISFTGTNAVQIITKANSSNGSFDSAAVPVAGGLPLLATRIFNLDGSQIATGSIPSWFAQAKIFLTSTRTTAGAPTYVGDDTPCAYFDSYSTDNNPDTSGFYTIDGAHDQNGNVDTDQCAGTALSELNQLAFYFQVNRAAMNATDKLQIIVKAKLIDPPNTAPTVSTCVVGGNFDASNCTNTLYTISMRSAPAAVTKPFYIMFPSAKALDLLSESILLPLPINTNITTISIDRVKGGMVLYGVTIVRLP